MRFKRNLIILSLVFLLNLPTFSQDFFDEMELVNISHESDVKSTIIRDPEQALLIVKSHISNLRFKSNNEIFDSKEVEPGRWHVKLKPGTHRISFQADGFISVQKRLYFNPKDVKGFLIRVIPSSERKKDKNVGIVIIKSEPEDAYVFFNNELYGTTPYMGKLLTGRYDLELKKDQFRNYKEEIIIAPNETLPIKVIMDAGIGLTAEELKTQKNYVAILDFEGRGISKSEAATLTDRFRNEIVNRGVFIVLNRGKMQDILQEIGFQESGSISIEYTVKVGSLLNVDKMIAGSIGKIGDTYTIDISFLDVKTSRIDWSSVQDFRGEKDLLLETLRNMALDLSNNFIEDKDSDSNLWYWVGGGAIVLGTALYFLLQPEPSKEEQEKLPGADGIWPPL
jgi:hypothetical protein